MEAVDANVLTEDKTMATAWDTELKSLPDIACLAYPPRNSLLMMDFELDW